MNIFRKTFRALLMIFVGFVLLSNCTFKAEGDDDLQIDLVISDYFKRNCISAIRLNVNKNQKIDVLGENVRGKSGVRFLFADKQLNRDSTFGELQIHSGDTIFAAIHVPTYLSGKSLCKELVTSQVVRFNMFMFDYRKRTYYGKKVMYMNKNLPMKMNGLAKAWSSEAHFIFGEEQVNSDYTVEQLGIRKDGNVFAVTNVPQEADLMQFYREYIKDLPTVSNACLGELSKMHDIQFNKLELDVREARRYMDEESKRPNEGACVNEHSTVVDYEPPEEPSIEPMPVVWT